MQRFKIEQQLKNAIFCTLSISLWNILHIEINAMLLNKGHSHMHINEINIDWNIRCDSLETNMRKTNMSNLDGRRGEGRGKWEILKSKQVY